MTRRARLAVVAGLIALAAWWGLRRDPPAPRPRPAADRTIGRDLGTAIAKVRAARGGRAAADGDDEAEVAPLATISIAGRVVDVEGQRPVGDVEVVFRGADGETTTTSGLDGAYEIHVAPGVYRAFVRDDAVVSFARGRLERLPGPPSLAAAGLPDDSLMTIVAALHDTTGVDLAVVGGGIVVGRVIDGAGQPIAGAVVRASRRGGPRPALGTDVAESDRDGRFELQLPAGAYLMEAAHPRFAGVAALPGAYPVFQLAAGARLEQTLVLAAGCVITGRVVAADGRPAGDGAIERGIEENRFFPVGQIATNGTFRWTTTEALEVTLRAWPWKAPPSATQQFTCADGARFDDVVFRLGNDRPVLEGVLVDAAGAPVAGAFVDLAPVDPDSPGGFGQQERTDAQGRWAAYLMPAGRYRVTAQVDGRGIAQATFTSPSSGLRLVLGGTGRIEGTAPRLASGSFELALGTCSDGGGTIGLPEGRRFVQVTGGTFVVDDVPACALSFAATWRGNTLTADVVVPSGGTGRVVLDLGPPRAKTVRGVVRDGAGTPVADAEISTGEAGVVTRSGADGAYKIDTVAHAYLLVVAPQGATAVEVSDQPGDEQIDLVLDGLRVDEDVEADD